MLVNTSPGLSICHYVMKNTPVTAGLVYVCQKLLQNNNVMSLLSFCIDYEQANNNAFIFVQIPNMEVMSHLYFLESKHHKISMMQWCHSVRRSERVSSRLLCTMRLFSLENKYYNFLQRFIIFIKMFTRYFCTAYNLEMGVILRF